MNLISVWYLFDTDKLLYKLQKDKFKSAKQVLMNICSEHQVSNEQKFFEQSSNEL